MTFVFDPRKLSKKTIAILLVIAGGSLTAQTSFFKDKVLPLLANHPHLTTLATGLMMFLTALHNPLVIKVLDSFQVDQQTQLPDGSTEKTTLTVEKILPDEPPAK